jgi:hypothetical protein
MTPPPVPGSDAAKELAASGRALAQKVVQEIGKVVVGMEGVTRQLLIALLPAGVELCQKLPPQLVEATYEIALDLFDF